MKTVAHARRFILAADFFRRDTGGQNQRAKTACGPQAAPRHQERSSSCQSAQWRIRRGGFDNMSPIYWHEGFSGSDHQKAFRNVSPPAVGCRSGVDSPAFATLKPIDIAVLLLLIREHNGHNNGGIGLGLREIASRCHCSFSTASRALDRLKKSRSDHRHVQGTSRSRIRPARCGDEVADQFRQQQRDGNADSAAR